MNIFTIFFYKILAKYSPNAPNCTIFKNFLGGACPRTPLTNAWRSAMQIPTLFQKYFEPPPPPPPPNEILDLPLDEITHTLFLVDTGAFYSVYPAAPHERHIVDTDTLLLTAANGTVIVISSHGTKDIQLQFHSRKYTWSFRLAQVPQHFLGSDFLAQHTGACPGIARGVGQNI